MSDEAGIQRTHGRHENSRHRCVHLLVTITIGVCASCADNNVSNQGAIGLGTGLGSMERVRDLKLKLRSTYYESTHVTSHGSRGGSMDRDMRIYTSPSVHAVQCTRVVLWNEVV